MALYFGCRAQLINILIWGKIKMKEMILTRHEETSLKEFKLLIHFKLPAMFLVLLFVLTSVLSGQEIEWIRQFGSSGPAEDLAEAVDANGNIYIAGRVYGTLPGQTSAGVSDVYIRKYDPDSNELWTRQFGSTSNDWILGISVDATALYVAGYTYGTLPDQSRVGNYDAFIKKYDLDGNALWTRQFGTTTRDYAYGVSVDLTGVYVSGYTYGTLAGQIRAGNNDAFVRKYDLSGTELWTRQFGTAANDLSYGISVDATGLYVAGYTNGALPGQTSTGNNDAFVRKYDSNGNELWTRQFGTAANDQVRGISVEATAVYVSGQTDGTFSGQTNAGGFDAFVCKYDVDGNQQWIQQFGTTSNDYGYGITVYATEVYVSGYTEGDLPGQTNSGGSDAFVRKYDLSGNSLWTSQFGTASYDYGFGISVDATGLYVAGQTYGIFQSQTSSGGSDAFLRKYDLSGNELWTSQFGSALPADDLAEVVDANGNIYIAGETDGTFPDQSNAGGNDAFVRKYDPDGNELWTRQFGSESNDYCWGISVDATAIYLSGYTLGTLPDQSNEGGSDAFVCKYDADGNVLWTRQFGTDADDYGHGIFVNTTGVYVAGYTDGAFSGQTNAGNSDVFIRKYDSDGNELWTRQFGTASADYAFGISVDVTGLYIVGYTMGGTLSGQTGMGGDDAFVCKYDLSGDEQWIRQFGTAALDRAYGISIDATAVYVAGYTEGAFSGQTNTGSYDAFICKFDLSGNEMWTAQFGTSLIDCAYGVSVDASGVHASGYTEGSFPGQINAGSYDAFVRKYDLSGIESWTTQFGTTNYDWAYGISVNPTGVYVAGYTYGTFPGQSGVGGKDAFLTKLMQGNQPPVADANGPFSVDEGGFVVVTASGSDPDNDPLTFDWDLDNDGLFEISGQSVTFSALDLDGPSIQTIVVKVTDSGGLFATDQATVEIANVAPILAEITAPIEPVQVNTGITAAANFIDPGLPDIHTASWDWGDGNSLPGIVEETDGSGIVTGSHTYSAAGVYTVSLIVWDDDTDSDTSVFRFVVIFDPSAGYVTGAGWIDSPAGAYTPEPSLTGKAKFGFESKYKKGQSTPDGHTKFSFKTADLKFESTSYDWLVIAGPHAKYKGSGKINDSGDYGFMLTAIDGQINDGDGIDKFRIKIWEKATDQVVYDNQLGDPDDSDATDAIEAGSIVIHQGTSLPKPEIFADDTEPEAKPKLFVLFQNYPNPFNPETMIQFEIPQANYVVVRIFNTLGAEIRKVVNGQYDAGNYSVNWDGRDNSGKAVSSGTYIYQIQAGQFVDIKKMLLVRQKHLFKSQKLWFRLS